MVLFEIKAQGGVEPYRFIWSSIGETNSNRVENVCSGQYQVKVIDDNGCEKTLDINLSNPEPYQIDLGGSGINLPRGEYNTQYRRGVCFMVFC